MLDVEMMPKGMFANEKCDSGAMGSHERFDTILAIMNCQYHGQSHGYLPCGDFITHMGTVTIGPATRERWNYRKLINSMALVTAETLEQECQLRLVLQTETHLDCPLQLQCNPDTEIRRISVAPSRASPLDWPVPRSGPQPSLD